MDIQKLLFTLCLILTIHHASAQVCNEEPRFTNTDYFSNIQIDSLKNVTYGEATDYKGNSQDLKMDVYFPNTELDTLKKRPFILLIHGGGFTGGTRERMTYHSVELSKRGFVVATISYRLGYDVEIFGSIQKAVYRAQHVELYILLFECCQKSLHRSPDDNLLWPLQILF